MNGRRIVLLSAALAAAFLVAGWLTLGRYGITWDEPENFLTGDLYLRFWASGDRAWLDFETLKNRWALSEKRPYFYAFIFARQERYPPVANLVSAFTGWLLSERLALADPIVAHHAAIPLFGALGVLVAGVIAGVSATGRAGTEPAPTDDRERGRWLAALVAGGTLALFPLYWNHAHNNVKDVPAAALFLATLAAAWRAFGGRRSVDWRWAVAAGALWGLALGTKANALTLPLIVLAWLGWTWLWPRWKGARAGKSPLVAAAGLALLGAIGLAVLIAAWPYLWPDPLRRLYGVLRYFAGVGKGYRVYFEGQTYLAGETLPWRYALTHLILTTPLATLALAGVGVARAFRSAFRGEDSLATLCLIALGATLVRVSLPGMTIYNGLRQLMEIAPLLCIMAGWGADWLWSAGAPALESRRWLASAGRRGLAAALLLAGLFVPQVAQLARLHPYEGAFFNLLAGGMERAGERYTLEYWGQSYQEGAAWLNAHAGPGAWVAVPIASHIARFSLRPDLRLLAAQQSHELDGQTGEGYVMLMRSRDWYDGPMSLANTCERYGEPIYTVRAGGAVILSIYRWPLTS